MRRSRLESYEATLDVLVKRPLTVDEIAYETSMDCTVLRGYLDFLVKNGLVEERFSNEKTVYAITERGIAVFRTLNFQKYLEKVAKSMRAMDDASQVVPIISKRISEQEKKNEDQT